jgi:hypothetical protein
MTNKKSKGAKASNTKSKAPCALLPKPASKVACLAAAKASKTTAVKAKKSALARLASLVKSLLLGR